MGHWNYRVIKTQPKGRPLYEATCSIHEVYYDDDGKIYGWTADPTDVYGESLHELKEGLEWMLEALEKPVLLIPRG